MIKLKNLILWLPRQLNKVWKGYERNFQKIHLVFIPNIILLTLGSYLLLHSFSDYKVDTITLTNYIFAIFIGLSAVCFSWTRALNQTEEPKMYERILKAGELSLHSGIIFLIASSLKYMMLHLQFIVSIKQEVFYHTLYIILLISYLLIFAIGYYNASKAIIELNIILYKRLYDNEKY